MRNRTENFIILLVSLACMGLTVKSILMGWEFWVPPLIIIGAVFLWVMNIFRRVDFEIRQVYYLVYAMLCLFYYGVHASSYFDIALVTALVMVGYSFFGHAYMMNLYLAEYIIIEGIQFLFLTDEGPVEFNAPTISRVILHNATVLLTYFLCVRRISEQAEVDEEVKEKDAMIEAYDADMEDFLSNISHELRTPVNVVNGMSNLLIKRSDVPEAFPILEAGLRLQYQIEDIQDYTECKRKKVMLEDEIYMSPSLINDVVTSFRMIDNSGRLELVVDMSPLVPISLRGDIRKLHKIFRHLLENAVKFTKRGGILVKMFTEKTDYGVNLCIEMEDTGIGMDRKALQSVSQGLYQVNKKRNRSSGGIGLGLFIVYGFAHRMGGFVKIESEKKVGTMLRVTIPQKVVDDTPCLALSDSFNGSILFHVRSDKYKVPKVRDFYRTMATNLAIGIRVPLYSAETLKDIERLKEKLNVTHIFMGQEEYEENPEYFDRLSEEVVVAVSAYADFEPNKGSHVMVMPKPLYAYPVVKILNEGRDAKDIEYMDAAGKPNFEGVRTLIVDDEPMNLVVAESLFREYDMITDLAPSGEEAIAKYRDGDYDVIFMDHMMPEMDGVEVMKHIRQIAEETGRQIHIVVLTANVVSGAREMFMEEGFDAFLAKPINIADFERIMLSIVPDRTVRPPEQDEK